MPGDVIVTVDFTGLTSGAAWPAARWAWRSGNSSQVTRDIQSERGRTFSAAGVGYAGGYHTLLDGNVDAPPPPPPSGDLAAAGTRIDPGMPTQVPGLGVPFDTVRYVAAGGSSTGDGLSAGAPVSIFRAWDIARGLAGTSSALFRMAGGNYGRVHLGGKGRDINATTTKPVYFVGEGALNAQPSVLFSSAGTNSTAFVIGGTNNVHFWRWRQNGGLKGVMVGYNPYASTVAGAMRNGGFRWFEAGNVDQEIFGIKCACENLYFEDFILHDSGVTQRHGTGSGVAASEGFYIGGNGFHEIGWSFRGIALDQYMGIPISPIIRRGIIRNIYGGEAIDLKPKSHNLTVESVLIEDTYTMYNGAISLGVQDTDASAFLSEKSWDEVGTVRIRGCVMRRNWAFSKFRAGMGQGETSVVAIWNGKSSVVERNDISQQGGFGIRLPHGPTSSVSDLTGGLPAGSSWPNVLPARVELRWNNVRDCPSGTFRQDSINPTPTVIREGNSFDPGGYVPPPT